MIFNISLPFSQTTVLSHENRHHYINRDVELVGLDDCRLTQFYDKPFLEIADQFDELGIEYYLYVTNEDRHPILKQLKVHENLDRYFDHIHTSGNESLYRLKKKENRLSIKINNTGF